MKPAGYAFFSEKMKEKLICRGTNYAVTGDGIIITRLYITT